MVICHVGSAGRLMMAARAISMIPLDVPLA
jgi:hypothetical protein